MGSPKTVSIIALTALIAKNEKENKNQNFRSPVMLNLLGLVDEFDEVTTCFFCGLIDRDKIQRLLLLSFDCGTFTCAVESLPYYKWNNLCISHAHIHDMSCSFAVLILTVLLKYHRPAQLLTRLITP